MEVMLDKIDLKHLDKGSWNTFKFEEIAHRISKTVKPEEANVDVYVGLEHLDAEDIHIRRKGTRVIRVRFNFSISCSCCNWSINIIR